MINIQDKYSTNPPRISSDTQGMELSNIEQKMLLEFFPDGLIAIDLETTGLSPLVDRIIEIAAYKVTSEGVSVFSTLLNPEIDIPPHTTAIHNITDEMVANAPKLIQVLTELRDFLGELPIVAHNAKFDLGFIVMGLQREKMELSNAPIYCSCKMARITHKEVLNHKLGTLVKELGIPLLNHHRALDDAYASLKIFIKGLERLTPHKKHEELRVNGHVFSLGQFDEIKSEELPVHLEELNKLVKESAVIEMLYAGGNHRKEFRPVKLTSLLNTPDGNILYALCLWSDMYKSFKLNKIKAIRHPSAEQIQKWLLKEPKKSKS
ncbi:MAG: 3'-5' exonuclease [Bacteriovorax sp.]|nr:3'-5' exonuclease [Bacteriovorax sp.]